MAQIYTGTIFMVPLIYINTTCFKLQSERRRCTSPASFTALLAPSPRYAPAPPRPRATGTRGTRRQQRAPDARAGRGGRRVDVGGMGKGRRWGGAKDGLHSRVNAVLLLYIHFSLYPPVFSLPNKQTFACAPSSCRGNVPRPLRSRFFHSVRFVEGVPHLV
jgi:hypothetical protein